jgi:putative ABC transport system substrate-binding protein
MLDMRRREFVTLLGGAAAWPLVARAQRPAMPVVAFLHSGTAAAYKNSVASFRQGLIEAGYIENQNVAIEYHWADDQLERLPALAADLVRRQVAVIFAAGPTAAMAAKAATSTIPVVVTFGGDPVKYGLAISLNRPGGNVTGVTFITTELVSKRLELLCEAVPQARTVAYLRSPTQLLARPSLISAEQMTSDALDAARALGRQIIVLQVDSEREFEATFARLVDRQAGALVIATSPFFDSHEDTLAALALRHAMPTIYQRREFTAAGGLMSYGASYGDAFRQAAFYAGRILKGANPAELPFQQSTKFELVINLNTAKLLRLTVPDKLLALADEVIE